MSRKINFDVIFTYIIMKGEELMEDEVKELSLLNLYTTKIKLPEREIIRQRRCNERNAGCV